MFTVMAAVSAQLSDSAAAPEFVSLVIADEGAGMDASKVAAIKSGRASGVGLRGMRERVRQLQGDLDITSSERGTIIQIRLPVA